MSENNDKSWMKEQMDLLKKRNFKGIDEIDEMKFIDDSVLLDHFSKDEVVIQNKSANLIDVIDPDAPDFSKFGDLADVAELIYYKDLEEKLTKEEEKERDRKRKLLIEKDKKRRDKETKALDKAKEKKLKELKIVIERVKTNYFTSISEIDDALSIMKTSSSRPYNELYTYSGTLIARADRIELGKNGYYYLYDSYSKMFYLLLLDPKTKKNKELGRFTTENELIIEAKRMDEKNKLGFRKDPTITVRYSNISDKDKTVIK